jgi:hypothetical protein
MYAVAGPLGVKVLMCVVERGIEVEEVGVFVVHVRYVLALLCCCVGRVGIMALSGSARQVPGSGVAPCFI